MVTDGNYTYCDELFIIYINDLSLCFITKTNTVLLYVSYTSLKKKMGQTRSKGKFEKYLKRKQNHIIPWFMECSKEMMKRKFITVNAYTGKQDLKSIT